MNSNLKLALYSAVFLSVLIPTANAQEIFRIDVGKSYESYSESDLKRRVWELERAVAQLQSQVFQLAVNGVATQPQAREWTCQISAFGKHFDETRPTKAAATAAVIKKCAAATHVMHCSDDQVKCGNE